MENIKKTQAMRAAGLGCAISIAIIAYFLFSLPTEQLMDYLTALGHWFGASTTVGIFVLACLPVLVSVLFYWIYYWLKN
ncbi:hypothetical protein FHQ26_07335 [Testudinibacter sp. TR-2022]|uniref:hypothetical protein n=1 Tax=Testudinibacter sp. TR-2022 TaxID=2585029 RepID=UPI00111A7CA5|nr:hypothetical protein [Testudinibacter sp. TR-2022]TNH02582.1 hypothetical protein FHQ22_09810 [Pasteurellaceae bacterium Phil31]TNH08390.1 hypothetical protein FHQ25_09710 [Testudinibacter sp. TR-2022]TNH09141.1 hypothetical protein FHQ26_07335 [Testudinibacter sp. TR-2022]TNH12871.1 hypothetical protein FIA56_09095 [Testudinibacter sp. TR-2022]TNH18079.1 hypothetical protein FHQ23_06105 [Testudinibacter sp. TR-2022]